MLEFNIHLAWNRLKADLKDRNFVSPSFITNFLDADVEKWLIDTKMRFESGEYNAQSLEIVEVPKGKGLIRPGSLLTLNDNLFYSCLIQQCYERIFDKIQWAQNTIDFAYVICHENISTNGWFKNQYLGWTEFRNKSLEFINQGYQYVIVADLTAFYENIDISTLISDVRDCGISGDIEQQLSRCLNRWAQNSNKGIPQGNSASDILAKLYLNPVDLAMHNAHYTHLRYVDDFRIFCKSLSEAKRALIELTRLLRKRGLNLQSAKTQILLVTDAINQIEGIQPVIRIVSEKLRQEFLDLFDDNDYNENDEEEKEEEEIDEDDPPLKIVKATLKTYFVQSNDGRFDKTLFHYLINRLIDEKDGFAKKYCLSILDKHPEETSTILKYLKIFITSEHYGETVIMPLIKFLLSDQCVYDYQNYLILRWIVKNVENTFEELIELARNFAFDNNKPYYLRSVARELLGKFGNLADLDALGDLVHRTNSEMEKAELICCIHRMERGKRNTLYARVVKDGQFVEMAVKYIRQQNIT